MMAADSTVAHHDLSGLPSSDAVPFLHAAVQQGGYSLTLEVPLITPILWRPLIRLQQD